MGREWGEGGQFTSNLGPGRTGSHHTKEGFQVSKSELARGINKGKPARGIKRNCAITQCANLRVCMYHNDCMNAINKECV
jgi:hypothetical protein